jgi:hypothetical protein
MEKVYWKDIKEDAVIEYKHCSYYTDGKLIYWLISEDSEVSSYLSNKSNKRN